MKGSVIAAEAPEKRHLQVLHYADKSSLPIPEVEEDLVMVNQRVPNRVAMLFPCLPKYLEFLEILSISYLLS